jgi:iron complex outermembrane receptor protein
LGGHGARRNELTRLGQSYGTTGAFYCLNGNQAECNVEYPVGSKIFNALGGTQGLLGGGYQPIEVKRAITALAPCYQNGFGFNRSAMFGGCTGGNNPLDPAWISYTKAVAKVANDLADNLDDKPWEGDFNHAGNTRNDTYGVRFKSTTILPAELELSTVTGYDRYDRKVDIDLDFSPSTLFHILTRDHGRQFYQDVRLAGETAIVGDTPVTWDVGGWLLDEQIDVNVVNDFGRATAFSVGARDYTQELLSMAGYGSFSFDFWDDFTLDGGVRWNWERKDIDYQLVESGGALVTKLNEHDNWRAPTGTIKLTYRFREDTYAYWKYNRGWKPGHYNATGSRLRGVTIADPETIDAWETGLHAEWFGGLLGGEASLFYYNYKDYQIFYAQQFANSSPEFLVINANDAEVYGAEIDALLRPWAGGWVNVRFGWLETQFLDFVTIQQTNRSTPTGQIVVEREIQNSGNSLLNSPQFKISFTAEQMIPLGKYGYLVPRYDGAWTDITYYNAQQGQGIPNLQQVQFLPKGTTAQDAYWLHNARIAYRTPDGRLEIAAWGRNLEDKVVKAFAFDGSVFQATTIYFVGDPRTYGGTVTVTF